MRQGGQGSGGNRGAFTRITGTGLGCRGVHTRERTARLEGGLEMMATASVLGRRTKHGARELQELLKRRWPGRDLVWRHCRFLLQKGWAQYCPYEKGLKMAPRKKRWRQPRWAPRVPSSLRHPFLLPRNLPASFCSAKKIDYFPLQLTSGPGSHH